MIKRKRVIIKCVCVCVCVCVCTVCTHICKTWDLIKLTGYQNISAY